MLAFVAESPAGVETGVVLTSADVLSDLSALRHRAWRSTTRPCPTQFRLRDPDGNSLLIVAAP